MSLLGSACEPGKASKDDPEGEVTSPDTQEESAHASASPQDESTGPDPKEAATRPEQEGNSGDSTDISAPTASTTKESTPSGLDPGANAPPAPIADYCNRGAVSCFLPDRVKEGQLMDQGSAALNIRLNESVSVELPNTKTFFKSAIKLNPGTRPESDKSFKLPEKSIIGFDLWIRPQDPAAKYWNGFGIEGFLSLRKRTEDEISCIYNVGVSPTFPLIPKEEVMSRPAFFKEGEFKHVACAYDGSNVVAWVDGIEYPGPSHPRLLIKDDPTYILNWKSVADKPFDGHMGPLRIWHDIEKMREEMIQLHRALAQQSE